MNLIEIANPFVSFRLNSNINEISSLDLYDMKYDYFFESILLKNIPCIVKNVTKNWSCVKSWIDNNKINYKYLRKEFGSKLAPVANCNKRYFNAHEKTEMPISDFLDYLENIKDRPKILYLKDWHCQKQYSDNFYIVPQLFASDWLNEFALETKTDDFRFVYIGPKDSWTPFHVDVYNSYSWSTNIIGRKKWLLYPPGEEVKLMDNYGNLPFDCSSEVSNSAKCFEIIQNAGEAIFVPSGWYHQVWNIQDTISVNHNWINGCNIHILWKQLQVELKNVEKEIEDCKDMEDWQTHCQLLLKTSFGMNYTDFYNLLATITNRRMAKVKDNENFSCFNYEFGINYCIFDLIQIKRIIEEFLHHSKELKLNFKPDLLNNIEKTLISWK